MPSEYYGPYWCCPYCSGDEYQGDCHKPDHVRMYDDKPICEVCYNHIPRPEGMPDWYDLPGVDDPTKPAAVAEAREAFTKAAREFKDREEAWWATGRMPGPFQSAMIEAASLFRETYFAWLAAEQAEEGGSDAE